MRHALAVLSTVLTCSTIFAGPQAGPRQFGPATAEDLKRVDVQQKLQLTKDQLDKVKAAFKDYEAKVKAAYGPDDVAPDPEIITKLDKELSKTLTDLLTAKQKEKLSQIKVPLNVKYSKKSKP